MLVLVHWRDKISVYGPICLPPNAPCERLSQSSFYLTIEDIAQVDDAGNPGLMEQFAGS